VIPPILRENPNFRRYFIGQSVSMLGDQVTLIALPLTAVLALHASAAQILDRQQARPAYEKPHASQQLGVQVRDRVD
jgi:hypothetical protein